MIIVRYLIRETLKSQLAVFFVLFLVFFSQKFISVLAEASDGDIPASMILQVVGLNMPTMGLLMLPLSIYVGILLTFGRLYAESEITVMNATGIGNKFLIHAALYLAIITGGIAMVNSVWLAPWSQEKVAQLMEHLSTSSSIDLLKKGQFQTSPDGQAVVFVDDIKDKKLTNVFVAQPAPRGSTRPSVMFANSGVAQEFADGRQILTLKDGVRYEGVPNSLDYMNTSYDEYSGLIGQREAKKKKRKWEALPIKELWNNPNLEAKAELQWRITLIVCVPLLTLVVVPLSSVNPRQGRFAKLFPAVLLYLAYFLSISAMKSGIEDGSVPASVGMWAINAGLLVVGIILNSLDSIFVRKLKDRFKKKKGI
ncbi:MULTISPECIES: LPS export ABC transporter permease LptF [Vibrio]|uniref:Lipopolysaccharide export system permease protein LptF n=1 Tax=Vibrio algicola TaxID=2662262 RepID=A0A5Q0TB24_9VIBR|nr:LPS export ABC transporter permease LptF [Vibrio algicola]MBD1576214.1 LPS export ABC transporter permease LptF [Vibrio sp. S11_S32]